jgi:threonine dehydrogenase-like Zn-dependent dehydrogenase
MCRCPVSMSAGPTRFRWAHSSAKAWTIKTGQTHVQRYLKPLLERIEKSDIDPSFIITHRLKLDDAPEAYKTFRDKEDGCIKVVMTP